MSEQEIFNQRSDEGRTSTPRPDPTVLTTEALIREIASLRTLVDQRIAATKDVLDSKIEFGHEARTTLKELMETHLKAFDERVTERFRSQAEALRLAQETAEKAYSKVVDAIETRVLLEERVAGLITRTDDRFKAQQDAVAAAMAAADKAVEKANVATEKRFEGVNELSGQLSGLVNKMMPRSETNTLIDSMESKIGDIKSIVDKGFTGVDTRRIGETEFRNDTRANVAIVISLGLFIVTLLALVLTNTAHIAGGH